MKNTLEKLTKCRYPSIVAGRKFCCNFLKFNSSVKVLFSLNIADTLTSGFLMFSRGIERDQWHQMG